MSETTSNIAASPILPTEAESLFASLGRYDVLLLAISGGGDSMAMLELMAEWRGRRATLLAPAIFVATVDHRLRQESAAEAEFVARRCAELGLDHEILSWNDAKPRSGLPNAAREARYRLLHQHALHVAGAASCAVVTAHTQDDQAETLAMRLARGSGIDGLAAMMAERPMYEGSSITLARPLLSAPRERLRATLVARGLNWREDPSNDDDAFERVRVRRALEGLTAAGITSAALARTTRRMGDAREALGYADRAFEATLSLDYNGEIFASLDRAPFDAAPTLLRQRLLQRLIRRFGGDTPAPTLSEIEHLAARLSRGERTVTLGGAVVAAASRQLKVWREPGRLTAQRLDLVPDAMALWDNRFWVLREGRPEIVVSVRPLGFDDARRLAPKWVASQRPPAAAIAALPAFFEGDELIAAPTIAQVAPATVEKDIVGLKLRAVAAAAERWC